MNFFTCITYRPNKLSKHTKIMIFMYFQLFTETNETDVAEFTRNLINYYNISAIYI